jgi:hypothetical protein
MNSKKNNKKKVEYYAIFVWYLVFTLIIPISIKSIYSFDSLRYYYPVIDLIANSFSASGGSEGVFKDLYNLSPYNITSFFSTNFINLLALMGVSWNGIVHAFRHHSIWHGVNITIFMYIITYLIPTQMIPYFIRKIQTKLDSYPSIHTDVKVFGRSIHLEDYIGAIIIIITLVFIEYMFVRTYIEYVVKS